MRIPFVTTFLTWFLSVKNNIPVDKESYVDEKIKDYIDTQVLVKIQEEEVEFAATKEEGPEQRQRDSRLHRSQ